MNAFRTLRRSRWRLPLVCLLAAALPLQGFAAEGLSRCALEHHETATSASGTAVHSATQMTPAVAHSHHHTLSAQASSHPATNGKCNACAPCCAGAALASSMVIFIAGVHFAVDFRPVAVKRPSIFISFLDRPPKSILA